MNKKLIIMRGIAGAGKTTEAKRIAKEYEDNGSVAVICSADQFFVDVHGKYNFDPKRLPAAHNYCRAKAEGAFEAKADVIILDNTNVRRWDFAPYVAMAKKYNYEVEEVVVGAFDEASVEAYYARNVHGVPKDTIQKMAGRFEK